MPRNAVIKLAGGTFSALTGLTGADALQDREVVLTTDTHELFVGNPSSSGTSGYSLLGSVIFCKTSRERAGHTPLPERLLWDDQEKLLYCGNGTIWEPTSVTIASDGALEKDSISNDLRVKVDKKFLKIESNEITFGDVIDYGSF